MNDLQGLVEKWRSRANKHRDIRFAMALKDCTDDLAEVIGRNVPDGADFKKYMNHLSPCLAGTVAGTPCTCGLEELKWPK